MKAIRGIYLTFVNLFFFLSLAYISDSSAQVIQFPIDNNGYVTLQSFGGVIELIGCWDCATPPDWRDLIDWDGPSCANVAMVEQWDCDNPERYDHTSLFFYFRFAVTFTPKCNGEVCFFSINYPDSGEVCVSNSSPKCEAYAYILDNCGNRIRGIRPGAYVDMEEGIHLTAEITCDSCSDGFPSTIWGRRTGCENPFEFEALNLISDSLCHAIYAGSYYHVKEFFPACEHGLLFYTIPYGYSHIDYAWADQTGFILENVIFHDTLSIEGGYLSHTVCYPQGSSLSLGFEGHLGKLDWPDVCEPINCVINGYENGNWVVSGVCDSLEVGQFHAVPDSSNYHINGYAFDEVNLLYYVDLDYDSLRFVQSILPPLRIYHAFRADSVYYYSPRPDSLFVGDSVRVRANPFPLLSDRASRIQYIWSYTPVFGGHGHFHTNYAYCKNNSFKADSPGTYNIRYIVKDLVNNYQDTSNWSSVKVVARPSIQITKPSTGTKLTFNILAAGVLTVKCEATTIPSALRDSVQWSVTPIAGSKLTCTPASAKGRSVVFEYNGLPDSNCQFGPKYVKAALPQYGVAESVMIKTYFAKRATNHPGSGNGTTPNWYYYWGQTTAPMGTPSQRQYGGALCGSGLAGYLDPITFDYYHICDTASTESWVSCDGPLGSSWNGIDLFAAECRHEYEHLINYAAWWPNGYIQSMDLDSLGVNPPEAPGDGIPDSMEGPGHTFPLFDRGFKDSNLNGVRDWDELCDSTKCDWTKGSEDSRDWSNPGHQ